MQEAFGHAHDNLNLRRLRMFEGTISLNTANRVNIIIATDKALFSSEKC